ncbi:MAG: CsgG/HfaB family protein [candidate division WOR-3 bacterium]
MVFGRLLVVITLLSIVCSCAPIRGNVELADIRVAVIPVENFSSDTLAGEKIRRMVVQELVRRNVEVVEIGEVDRVMEEEGLTDIKTLGQGALMKLTHLLKVNYIIKGAVFSYDMGRLGDTLYPSVALNLTLINNEGKVVASVIDTEGGPSVMTLYFGTYPEPPSEVAKRVVSRVLDKLFEKRRQ